ncbi:Chaperone protein dnaJ 1, mitochondrial [Orobanche minor]
MEAILGGTIEVPTLSGKMQLQIPNRVEHGQLSVLRGKGMEFCLNLADLLLSFLVY